jgi:hypothetical protein
LDDIPLFISGTLVDASGRTLSGQTTEGKIALFMLSFLLRYFVVTVPTSVSCFHDQRFT